MTRATFAIGVVVMCTATATLAQTVNLKPGQYEVTTEMSFPGMKLPPQTRQECIPSSDFKEIARKLMDLNNVNSDCKTSEPKLTANTVTFTRTCSNGVWSSELIYAGDSFSGTTKGKDNKGGDSTAKVTAKRIGDCTK